MTTQEAIAKLIKAAKTLKIVQGDVARRNARRRTGSAIRVLHAVINVEFPAPRRKRRSRQLGHVTELLAERGYVQVVSMVVLERLAVAGIKVVRPKGLGLYAPRWAIMMVHENEPAAMINRCKKDYRSRKAWLAAHTLMHAKI